MHRYITQRIGGGGGAGDIAIIITCGGSRRVPVVSPFKYSSGSLKAHPVPIQQHYMLTTLQGIERVLRMK